MSSPAQPQPLRWWPGVRPALAIWVSSRLALVVFVWLASYLLGLYDSSPARYPGAGLLDRFVWWDSFHFLRIADLGYFPPGVPCCDQAYLPGYPLAIRAVSSLGLDSMVAGLLVTWVAGVVAAVFLWRVAAEASGDPRVGTRAVLFLAVAPYGIFLSAMYSEALFLAFALAAWWAGTHRSWWLAGVLAAGAATVRINGLFLAVALAVMYLEQLRADRRLVPRPDALALLLPGIAVAAYFAFLHAETGSWTEWSDAEEKGWQRMTAWPWQGLAAGWDAARSASVPDVTVAAWAELFFALVGIVLTAVLIARRQWPAATYVGLSVAVLVSSTPLASVPRYALMWFPGYVLAAQLAQRPRWQWLQGGVVAVSLPLLAAFSLAFAAHLWVS